ncbi:MAG TPA: efflux RND transporter periplasmic adaptor subunit [Desulfatiglandales bacterium]|nr:efflux RND transporter periplasmic adaptor subunit [Desulfatiglandales bacterium]
MKNRWMWLLPLFFFQAGCGEKIEPGTTSQTPPVVKDVEVGTAAIKEYPVLYEAVGTVQAGATVNLASKLMGTIEKVKVREGDQVKTGDVLVVIDQRQVDAGYRQAEANLAEAKKALDASMSSREAALASERLSRATYDRYLNLQKQDSVSAQEFDEVEARYREATAGVKRAEAMVETATARIHQAEAGLASASVTRRDAVITAPGDGVITSKLVDEGDLASPGMPLLSMDTTDGYRVDAILPENYFQEVKPGQSVRVTVPAIREEALPGTIRTIVPAADQHSRSFLIKVTLPQDLAVKSGMFARVEVPLGRTSKMLIPPRAVIHQGQLTALFVLKDQDIARFRLIRLGRISSEGVEVLSGLETGERFAVELVPQLRDGVRVEVKP